VLRQASGDEETQGMNALVMMAELQRTLWTRFSWRPSILSLVDWAGFLLDIVATDTFFAKVLGKPQGQIHFKGDYLAMDGFFPSIFLF